jgi:hypothetical protein
MWIARNPELTYERFYQFATYSYVRSHLGNDRCLPIYKTNPAFMRYSASNPLRHGVDGVVMWAELWFVVECRALCKKNIL